MRIRPLAIAVLVGASLLSAAAPAIAHDELISSTPSDGQALETAPSSVSITFGEELIDLGNAITVVDAAGTDWVDGAVNVSGATATAALKPGLPNGVYTLDWRVVSTDGHPVSSRIIFAVGTDESTRAALAAALAAESGESIDQATPPADSGWLAGALTATAIAVIALVALVLGLVWWARRRRAAQSGSED